MSVDLISCRTHLLLLYPYLLGSNSYLVEYLVFSMYKMLSSLNRSSFISSLIWLLFITFSSSFPWLGPSHLVLQARSRTGASSTGWKRLRKAFTNCCLELSVAHCEKLLSLGEGLMTKNWSKLTLAYCDWVPDNPYIAIGQETQTGA